VWFLAFLFLCRFSLAAGPESAVQVPILVYHRAGQTVTDIMKVSVWVFEAQLALIQRGGCHGPDAYAVDRDYSRRRS